MYLTHGAILKCARDAIIGNSKTSSWRYVPQGARGSVNWNESVRMKILCYQGVGARTILSLEFYVFASLFLFNGHYGMRTSEPSAFETAFHLQGLTSRFPLLELKLSIQYFKLFFKKFLLFALLYIYNHDYIKSDYKDINR